MASKNRKPWPQYNIASMNSLKTPTASIDRHCSPCEWKQHASRQVITPVNRNHNKRGGNTRKVQNFISFHTTTNSQTSPEAMSNDERFAQIHSRNLPYQGTTAVIGYHGVQKLRQYNSSHLRFLWSDSIM